MKLSLDLLNQNVVRKDGTVWKSISTWVNGGSGNEEYYDVSSCGEFWSKNEHFESVEIFKTITCYAKFKLTNITPKYCPLIQVKVSSSTIPIDPSVAITAEGKLMINGNSYDVVDYTNSFIEVTITFNNGVATTKAKIDGYTYEDSYTYSNTFTLVLAQIGAKANVIYTLPDNTYLYDFYLTDEDPTPTPTPTGSKFLNTNGLIKVWEQIGKKYYSKEEVDTSLSGKQDALSSQQIANINDVTNKANDSDVVHKSGDETISGLKTFLKQDNTQEGGQIDLEKSTSSVLRSNISIDNRDDSLRFFAKNSDGDYATFWIDFQNRVVWCDRECDLGTSTNKWKTINGIDPGALSLPNGQTAIYVSPSYTVGGTMTMPYTGFLRVVTDSNVNYALVITTTAGVDETVFDTNRSALTLIPVVKGEVLKVDVCTVTSGVYMRLLPSIGNVGEN